jgi:hypothetical protein
MALNFPSSPTNNQVFDNWIYSSAKGAWEAKPLTPGVATPSPTAPLAPKQGDLWYNTEDGNTYVRYTDVDGSQWVQLKSDATLSSTLGTRVSALEAFPNGLVDLVPASVTVGSGSASINSSGLVTFTGATSISLNGVFTSAYKHYRILFHPDSSTVNANIVIRFRSAGVDNALEYYTAGWLGTSEGATGSTHWAQNNSTAGFLGRSWNATSGYSSSSLDVSNPQVTGRTFARFQSNALDSAGRVASITGIVSQNNASLSFDGMTFLLDAAGNMTGSLQVYGYR